MGQLSVKCLTSGHIPLKGLGRVLQIHRCTDAIERCSSVKYDDTAESVDSRPVSEIL